jgi:hypothetical protein
LQINSTFISLETAKRIAITKRIDRGEASRRDSGMRRVESKGREQKTQNKAKRLPKANKQSKEQREQKRLPKHTQTKRGYPTKRNKERLPKKRRRQHRSDQI